MGEQLKNITDEDFMNKKTTKERAIKVISDKSGVLVPAILNNMKLTSQLGIDSLDHVEMTIGLEEEFDIEITDEDAEKWKTVVGVIKYIEGRFPPDKDFEQKPIRDDSKAFVKLPYNDYHKVVGILQRWLAHRLHAVNTEEVEKMHKVLLGLKVEGIEK